MKRDIYRNLMELRTYYKNLYMKRYLSLENKFSDIITPRYEIRCRKL